MRKGAAALLLAAMLGLTACANTEEGIEEDVEENVDEVGDEADEALEEDEGEG
jgi:predicted small secreted protein